MKLIWKAFRTKEECFFFSFWKTGDVISGSKGRQITKYRISIGKQMISNAIWNKQAPVNFFKG